MKLGKGFDTRHLLNEKNNIIDNVNSKTMQLLGVK